MENKHSKQSVILFGKENYMLMIGGVVIIAIGFLLMIGGASTDPNEFNPDEVYSFRRTALAPLVVVIGFIVEIFAIMRKQKK